MHEHDCEGIGPVHAGENFVKVTISPKQHRFMRGRSNLAGEGLMELRRGEG